jgi:hypothetical protein
MEALLSPPLAASDDTGDYGQQQLSAQPDRARLQENQQQLQQIPWQHQLLGYGDSDDEEEEDDGDAEVRMTRPMPGCDSSSRWMRRWEQVFLLACLTASGEVMHLAWWAAVISIGPVATAPYRALLPL